MQHSSKTELVVLTPGGRAPVSDRQEGPDDRSPPRVSRLSRLIGIDRWFWVVLPLIAVLGVFFAYPLFEFIRHSFTSFIAPERGGLDNYRWFFHTSVNWTVLERTLYTSAIVTAICALLAYPYAYLMTLVTPTWRLLMLGVIILAFWTSAMVKLYAWVVLLQDNGVMNRALGLVGIGPITFLGNVSGVVIGMVQLLLPFMLLPLYATLQGIDRSYVTAAQSLGASPHRAFRKVYLPLSIPGLLTGGLLVFVISLGYYLTPALLGSTENSLFSQLIVTQVNQNLAFGRAGVMTVMLLVITFALIGFAFRLSKDAVTAAYGAA